MGYLIIGAGKVAKHIEHYLRLLNLPVHTWNRQQNLSVLQDSLKKCSRILLLISDPAIETFYHEHLKSCGKPVIHFSGAYEFDGIIGAHPLMTFGPSLYDFEQYQKIPFVLCAKESLEEILPGLPNKAYFLPAELKSKYHAFCVMSGNFTTLLWQNMFSFLDENGLPAEMAYPYLEQIMQNLTQEAQALTGPFARKDSQTVQKHLEVLKSDPTEKIYKAFVHTHFPEFKEVP